MSNVNRRDFMRISGVGLAASATAGQLTFNKNASAANTFNVVIVGGGFSGASCARYLKQWSATDGVSINVTLIDRNAVYASPILSNLVLVGGLAKTKLDFNYDSLRALGVKVINAEVNGIDTVSRSVAAGGVQYSYDKLVIAPGIDFDYTNASNNAVIDGLESAILAKKIIPAWKGGSDVEALRQQMVNAPSGSTYILSIPQAPYRCPPGPYERACVVADWLKKNKNGKVIVLDANSAIQAEANTFTNAFAKAGNVTYVPSSHLLSVAKSVTNWTVVATTGTYSGQVLNVLPRQRAGKVLDLIPAILAGGRFAPVHGLTYESLVPGFAGVHVIGDAQGTPQPKAGHIGNGEGKVCAEALISMLKYSFADTQAYLNGAGSGNVPPVVTNSACYSPITASSSKTASYLTAGYRTDINSVNWSPVKIVESVGEAPSPTGDNFSKMYSWATNLFNDTFAITRSM